MKSVGEPKHLFDFQHQRKVARSLDALLNGFIVNENGYPIGEVRYADGNTVFQINVNVDRWQKPKKELDPAVAVRKGTWVYVSPNNALVTDGMEDLQSAATVNAYPGIWEAAQDVPATEDGVTYNVPTTDYPSTTPSGSPLSGDLDEESVFWILICPTCNVA